MWNTSWRGRVHKREHKHWSCSWGAGELESWSLAFSFANRALKGDRGGPGWERGEEGEGWWLGWDLGNDNFWAVLSLKGVLDTSEVQDRRVVTHLKPSGWLVELGCWYAWA